MTGEEMDNQETMTVMRSAFDMWPRAAGGPVLPGDVLWDADGEPVIVGEVRFGDRGPLVEIRRRIDGEGDGLRCQIVRADSEALTGLTRTEPPKPVLDRDGVPIEIGDTVYEVTGASEGADFIVDRVGRGGGLCVRVHRTSGYVYILRPEDLTHERPDSWERLTEDAGQGACDYFGSEYCECGGCPHEMEPDCNVVMAMDIVRRAKALAGVVGDE